MNTEQRQRGRVSLAIKLALARIAEKNPELARLLKETIKTGTYLSYSPPSQANPRRKSKQTKKNSTSPMREPGSATER
jgi:hypothetical protein